MFLKAEIGGVAVNCLIDTGSSLSTIHPALYNRLAEKPVLSESDVRLRMADGSLVPVSGEASFTVQIKGVSYTQTMAVAEIETPVVLGYDYVQTPLPDKRSKRGNHFKWKFDQVCL